MMPWMRGAKSSVTKVGSARRRPLAMSLQAAVFFFAACANAPVAPPPPPWVSGVLPDLPGRTVVVARGGPAGLPSDARRIALERGVRDLARQRGSVRVVARNYDRQSDSGEQQTGQAASEDESETLMKAVLEDLKVESEWVDETGSYSQVRGRVYYLLLSVPET